MVTVDVVDPSAVTLDGDATTVDCAAVGAPAVNVTVAVCVISVSVAVDPRRARTVTDPAVVDDTATVASPEESVVAVLALKVPVPEEIST